MFYKGEVPVVRLLVPLIMGILSACVFPQGTVFIVSGWLAMLSLGFAFLFIINYRRFGFYRSRWAPGATLCFCLLAAGYLLTGYTSQKFDESHYKFQKADALVATITSEPKRSTNTWRFEAQVNVCLNKAGKSRATGKMLISVHTTRTPDLTYGDVVLLPGMYSSVNPPYNPGEFDYKSYLDDRQIYYQAFLKDDQIKLIDRNQGNGIISCAFKLRKQLVDKFYLYLPDNQAAAFASTLILGYRSELNSELIKAYSKTGTMHILSVSGMHVGIVFMVLSAILKFMDRSHLTRILRASLIIAIIWLYAMLTGFSPPVCRAAVMLSFIVLGKTINKSQNTYNLIAISAFFLLIYNPYYLLDAGFQLSYFAVLGLVYFHPKIYQAIYIRNKLFDYIWNYSALSIGAQLATFPLSIYYFHQFPVYFLFSNLFIVVPVAIIMYMGIAFMFIPFPSLLFYFGHTLNWLITTTNDILYYIEDLPFSSWDGIWINTFECIVIGLIVILMSLIVSYKYKKLIAPAATLVIVLLISFDLRWVRNYRRNEIVFYNLRKNIGAAFIYKGQSVIISDLENSDKLLSFSVLPTVKSKGSDTETFYHTTDIFKGDFYSGNAGAYQLGNYRFLLWNKDYDNSIFSKELRVDAIVISGDPKVTLKEIQAVIHFKRIIIGANNSDYKVAKWLYEAREMDIQCYSLKRNPALVINLNRISAKR